MVTTRTDAEAPAVKEEIPHDHLFKVTGLSSSNLEKLAQEKASDFEEAMATTGYGRFNLVLMLCSVPAFWSNVSVTSSVSYIFARARCDMDLTLLDMGNLNAITYIGMIMSAMVWGFLSDTLGRKRIMVWGFLCSGVVELAAGLSQSLPMLLVTRFFSGFLFNGPFAVLLSYIAELHRTELRARVMLLTSLFYTLASTTLPMLAWAILTHHWEFQVGGLVIHSWNVFLLATALAPIITGLAFLCQPESPKFLMSRGRNEEALDIFRKIYSLNSGKPETDYPVRRLVEEKAEQQGRGLAALRGGVAQLTPLFQPPHLKWLVLVCTIHIGGMFGANTIRLWYPQLAAMIGSSSGSLCSALAAHAVPVADAACAPIQTDLLTYLQSAAVGVGSALTYGIGGAIINSSTTRVAAFPLIIWSSGAMAGTYIILVLQASAALGVSLGSVMLLARCGKKVVVGVCGVLSALVIVLLPLLGYDALSVAALVTAALAFTALFAAALSSVVVDLFPTSLRVMAMATFLMMGRLGTITGTIIFPALITYGCYPPFITIGTVLCICGVACCLLPNTTLKRLE